MKSLHITLSTAILACITATGWSQSSSSSTNDQPANNANSTTQSESPKTSSQTDLDRTKAPTANARRKASDAYANCGDYNVRAAAGSPPGSVDTKPVARQHTSARTPPARSEMARPDCSQKQ